MFEEIKNISKSKCLLLIIIMVAMIPAIYSTIFLGSVWKPYESLNKLPVAVVNNDNGYKIRDKQILIGKDLVDSLNKKNIMNFIEVSDENEAVSGLENGKYYMVLSITENFSKNAASILSDAPIEMNLNYYINPSLSFISTKITDSETKDIQKEVVKLVQKTYIDLLFDNMGNIREGIFYIKEGSKKITEGISGLKSGQEKFTSGVRDLNHGISKATMAAEQLKDAMNQYALALDEADKSSLKLTENSSLLLESIKKYHDGIYSGSKEITKGLEKLQEALDDADKTLPKSEVFDKLNDSWTKFNKLYENGSLLIDSQVKLNDGMKRFIEGIRSENGLIKSVEKLKKGSQELSNNIEKGNTQINSALSEYIIGTSKLRDGLGLLNNNFNKLNSGYSDFIVGLTTIEKSTQDILKANLSLLDATVAIDDANKGIYDKLAKSLDELVDYSFGDVNSKSLTEPIKINRYEITAIVNNGHAIAPYVITTALFIGGFALVLVYPLNKKRYKIESPIAWWMLKLNIIILESVIQSIILISSLILFLGFSPLFSFKALLVSMISSIAFISIISFFVMNLHTLGKFIVIIILIFQISTTEGSYPLALSSWFYKFVSLIMPSTYTSNALKEAISINGDVGIWLLILFIYIIIFNILNIVVSINLKKGRFARITRLLDRIRDEIELD